MGTDKAGYVVSVLVAKPWRQRRVSSCGGACRCAAFPPSSERKLRARSWAHDFAASGLRKASELSGHVAKGAAIWRGTGLRFDWTEQAAPWTCSGRRGRARLPILERVQVADRARGAAHRDQRS